MFNKVILMGNLTRDPEMRYSPQGTSVCKFSIAINRKFRQGEEFKEEVTFVNIVVFGKQADNSGKYLNKGSSVLIEGRLQENKWETEDGQKRSRMEVVAQDVRFMSQKNQSTSSGSGISEGDMTIPPQETTDIEPF
ncbi:MAG: single-stranded DNA-binding protein [Nitrospira sp.]|nr:single-stranded DNA-binding protein [bacterium]MBL7048302.1 single-stranded DNA-binding protein [Nitrospira sp.]